MKTIYLELIPALLLALLVSCAKPEVQAPKPAEAPKPLAIEVVQESQRSKHFLAVQKHLDLGGTLYGYVDVDGDAAKVASGLQEIMGNAADAQPQLAPFLKQDYPALFALLGLNDVRAIGLSSVPDGTGYFQNKVFFYMPEGRHGLLAGLGGAPAPFTRADNVPADVDIFCESELDLPEMYKAIKEIVTKVGGESSSNVMEEKMRNLGPQAAFSILDLIHGWKGHSTMVLRLSATEQIKLGDAPGFNIPTPSFLLSVEGIGRVLDAELEKSQLFVSHESGAAGTEGHLKYYEGKEPLPVNGIKPIIAIDGNTVYLASTLEFYTECRQVKGGLGQTPQFKQTLARIGAEGNGLGYVSPKFFARLRQLEALNPGLPEDGKRTLRMVLSKLPTQDRPVISIRSNLADGVLIRSYWDRSLKQDLAMISVYNPITVGLMAAMAIPAFQKVRVASQEKAVLNNLRQLSAAADQYYLEHGVNSVLYQDLVGPDKYIRKIIPVDGENYQSIIFRDGAPLRVTVPSLGKVIRYP